MTKEQLTEIAESVILNWNLDLGGERRKAFFRTWWRYLGDLDATSVQGAVDALVLADRPYAPRAGTVRRMVFADALADIPTLELAWAQACERITAVQQGTWSPVAGIVGEALAASGVTGTSRDDRDAFTRAWRRTVEELELERLGLPEGAE